MHGAFRVGCHHDQTFACDAIGVSAVHIGINTRSFQVVEIKLAKIIVGNLAGVIGRSAHGSNSD